MAGEAPAGSTPVSPATPDAGSKPTGTPNAPENVEPKFVTKEELVAQNAELVKRLDGQSATIKRLEKLVGKNEPATPAPKPTDLDSRVKELEQTAEAQRQVAEKQKSREVRSRLAEALVEKGKLSPADAARAANYIAADHKDRISVAETEDGEFSVTVKDGEKDSPVADWVGAYLQTDQGRFFLPTSRNPRVPGNPEAISAGPRQVSKADLEAGRVNPADILSGKVKVVD